MPYTICKRFEFSASHQLDHLPDGHQCGRRHGHNYVVEVILEADTVGADGFVVDYGELSALKAHIDEVFDHRHLNDVLGAYTTAENLAHFFYDFCKGRWPQTVAARVSETPKTWAEYRPGREVFVRRYLDKD